MPEQSHSEVGVVVLATSRSPRLRSEDVPYVLLGECGVRITRSPQPPQPAPRNAGQPGGVGGEIGEGRLPIRCGKAVRYLDGKVAPDGIVESHLAAAGHLGEEDSGEHLGYRSDLPHQTLGTRFRPERSHAGELGDPVVQRPHHDAGNAVTRLGEVLGTDHGPIMAR